MTYLNLKVSEFLLTHLILIAINSPKFNICMISAKGITFKVKAKTSPIHYIILFLLMKRGSKPICANFVNKLTMTFHVHVSIDIFYFK